MALRDGNALIGIQTKLCTAPFVKGLILDGKMGICPSTDLRENVPDVAQGWILEITRNCHRNERIAEQAHDTEALSRFAYVRRYKAGTHAQVHA